MADEQQAQFDGENPVSGYTLFHGKDGKSYYLKGENLADDDIKQRVTKLRGQSSAPDISSESSMAANPPKPTPMQMQSSLSDRVGGFLGSQQTPTIDQMRSSNVGAGKFGADMLMGQTAAGPVARMLNNNVVPALKSVPYMGRMVSAIDAAPGVGGKIIRGAAAGGTIGGAEGLIRGKGLGGAAEDAAAGAIAGGTMGAALPAISRIAGPSPEDYARRGEEIMAMRRLQPDAFAPTPPEPPPTYPGGSLPTYEDYAEGRGKEIMSARRLQPDAFAPPPAPEPELGSPENPAFHSKLSARLPPNLRGDPFSPSAPPQQVAPGVEAPSADVMRLPVPREPAPGENPNYAASIPRKDLEDLALQKKPGAGDQLRNIGKTVLYVPESYPGPRAADAYAPPVDVPDEMPQGNATPFSPTARMLMPRKKLVLQ